MGVIDVADDIAPGSEGELDAQAQEGQGSLHDDDAAQAHGAGDDQLGNDIGDQVLEDPAGHTEAAGLGGGHVLLLTQGQDLAADQTGDTSPAQEAQDQH